MTAQETFTGVCRDVTAKGLGVFDHPEGRVVFVAGAWPGDHGVVQVEQWEKRYGMGRLMELTVPSSQRQDVPCKYQGSTPDRCGGCPWMIADYSDQLKYKQQFVRHFLQRANVKHSADKVRDVIPSPKQWRYRNRAQFKTDGHKLGFVAQGTNAIIDIENCSILSERNQASLQAMRAQLPNPHWHPTAGRPWVFIDIDEDTDPDAVMLNKRLPFKQGNSDQNDFMRSWLKSRLSSIGTQGHALELFCGSGNFTEVISACGFDAIHAADVGSDAISQIQSRGLPGVTAHSCDLFKLGALNYLKRVSEPTILVLDPPRVGFRLLSSYSEAFSHLTDIFYISCDVPSFSYDIRELCEQDWQIQEIQPLDQFPHTPHVEVLAHLQKKVPPS